MRIWNADLRILDDGMNRIREKGKRKDKGKGKTKRDTKRKRFMLNDRITSTTTWDNGKALADKFLSFVRGDETVAAERANGSGAFARVIYPRQG
jgi:hypothetical protein